MIDVEALLAPIPGARPAGDDVSGAGLDEVRLSKKRAAEEWQARPGSKAEWTRTAQLAAEVLTARSKDLQAAVWLVEAATYVDGFRGLSAGLSVLRGLHERYWPALYPPVDPDGGDDDLQARANVLDRFDDYSALAAKLVPITAGGFGLLKLEDARRKKAFRSDKETAAEGGAAEEEFLKSLAATSRSALEPALQQVTEAASALEALSRSLDAHFGRTKAPGLRGLRNALESVRATLDDAVRQSPEPAGAGPAASAPARGAAGIAAAGVAVSFSGAIASRQEALDRLAEVARFFRATEPHSPISYLVERAIRWGEMPLEAWLADVLKDGAAMDQLRETLGLAGKADA